MITQLCLKFPIALRAAYGRGYKEAAPRLEEGAGEAQGPAPEM